MRRALTPYLDAVKDRVHVEPTEMKSKGKPFEVFEVFEVFDVRTLR